MNPKKNSSKKPRLSDEDAAALAAKLKSLRHFPGEVTIAELLVSFCETKAIAERVIEQVLTQLDEWPGPATFRRIARESSGDLETRPECRTWKPDYSNASRAACDECGDFGHVFVESTRKYRRCACAAGQELDGAILEKFNGPRSSSRGAPLIATTEAERDRMERMLSELKTPRRKM